MRYSLSYKESLIKKILPPESRSISSVCREEGISDQTLRNWLNKSKEGTLRLEPGVHGNSRPPREKLNLIMESRTVDEAEKGKWLREKGLHTEHLNQFEQEIRDLVEDNKHKEKQEIKELQKENKHLKKELDRKNKALAELAALYTLKKKAVEIWGEVEDD
ncbi:MAG: transposase [Clostridia bacterium]|nr:transposase [Clostridia bacterium]